MAINFRTLDIFDREFRKLIKKYPSLEKDFSLFQKFLEQEPVGLGIGDIERINGLGEEISSLFIRFVSSPVNHWHKIDLKVAYELFMSMMPRLIR